MLVPVDLKACSVCTAPRASIFHLWVCDWRHLPWGGSKIHRTEIMCGARLFRNSRSPAFSYLFRNTVLWFPNQKTNLSYINIDPQIFPKIREFSKIPFTLISYFNFIIWVNIELFILHFYEIINLNVIVKISLLLICQL